MEHRESTKINFFISLFYFEEYLEGPETPAQWNNKHLDLDNLEWGSPEVEPDFMPHNIMYLSEMLDNVMFLTSSIPVYETKDFLLEIGAAGPEFQS